MSWRCVCFFFLLFVESTPEICEREKNTPTSTFRPCYASRGNENLSYCIKYIERKLCLKCNTHNKWLASTMNTKAEIKKCIGKVTNERFKMWLPSLFVLCFILIHTHFFIYIHISSSYSVSLFFWNVFCFRLCFSDFLSAKIMEERKKPYFA